MYSKFLGGGVVGGGGCPKFFLLHFWTFHGPSSEKFLKFPQPRGQTAAPMFVLIYNGRIFGDKLAKPNTLDDIAKPHYKQILVLASLRLFFL